MKEEDGSGYIQRSVAIEKRVKAIVLTGDLFSQEYASDVIATVNAAVQQNIQIIIRFESDVAESKFSVDKFEDKTKIHVVNQSNYNEKLEELGIKEEADYLFAGIKYLSPSDFKLMYLIENNTVWNTFREIVNATIENNKRYGFLDNLNLDTDGIRQIYNEVKTLGVEAPKDVVESLLNRQFRETMESIKKGLSLQEHGINNNQEKQKIKSDIEKYVNKLANDLKEGYRLPFKVNFFHERNALFIKELKKKYAPYINQDNKEAVFNSLDEIHQRLDSQVTYSVVAQAIKQLEVHISSLEKTDHDKLAVAKVKGYIEKLEQLTYKFCEAKVFSQEARKEYYEALDGNFEESRKALFLPNAYWKTAIATVYTTEKHLQQEYKDLLEEERKSLLAYVQEHQAFENLEDKDKDKAKTTNEINSHFNGLKNYYDGVGTDNPQKKITELKNRNEKFISKINKKLRNDAENMDQTLSKSKERLNALITQPIMAKEVVEFEKIEKRADKKNQLEKAKDAKACKNDLLNQTIDFYRKEINQESVQKYCNTFNTTAQEGAKKIGIWNAGWKPVLGIIALSILPVVGWIALGVMAYKATKGQSLFLFDKKARAKVAEEGCKATTDVVKASITPAPVNN